jgi:uncharacterized protein YjiK
MIIRIHAHKPIVVLAGLGLFAACSPGSNSANGQSLGRFELGPESVQQWKLPKRLKEISGLALTPDGRLFAVADESAIIYELDYEQGRIIKAFALGYPTITADFEGIAYLNERLYIVTSKGRIYETSEGSDGERMQFMRYKTGLGKRCEIEGLAQDTKANVLLMACKQSRSKHPNAGIFVFVWSPSTGRIVTDREITIPHREIVDKLDKKRISPSGIVVDPQTSNLYLIAARERAIFALKPNGDLIDAIILPLADRHRQSEGLEISQDGELLIADEGGKKKARLSVYAPGPKQTTDQH